MKIILVCFDSVSEIVFQRFIQEYSESFIAKMASEGLRFTNNYSACTFSHPSYPSILFGVYPYEHGIWGTRSYKIKGNDLVSIHDELKMKGWTVSTRSDENWMFKGAYGYDVYPLGTAYEFKGIEEKCDKYFVFLNYWGTHYPFNVKVITGTDEKKEEMKQCIRIGDWKRVNEMRESFIIKQMKSLCYYSDCLEKIYMDKSVIILCSDHGDDYGLHVNHGHGGLPWDSMAKTPLVVYPYKRERIDSLFSNVYIKEIVLSLANGEEFQIKPLKCVKLSGGSNQIEQMGSICSSGLVFEDKIKYIRWGEGKDYVYDLEKDPGEYFNAQHMIKDEWREECRKDYPFLYDKKLYIEHINRVANDLDEEVKKRLEALGYI